MLLPDAEALLGAFLAPLSADAFLDETLRGAVARPIPHAGGGTRLGLLGADPFATLAGAAHLAGKLTWHSANASGPAPSLADVDGAESFRARIAEFHARNYSVRFPDLRPLAPEADRLARALEVLLHMPVTVSAFWSRTGMRAPVHFDDHDLIVVQLKGTKRWYVSKGVSTLPNPWKSVSGSAVELGDHAVLDLKPGDAMYLPRGTPHTVDSTEESLHAAIGFTPLTVREAVLATLDHLSDVEPALRTTLGARLGHRIRGGQLDPLAGPVGQAASQLLQAARTPGFVGAALHRRSSRTIGGLPAGPRPGTSPTLTLQTRLRHAAGAFSHLTANAETVDFAYPGGHLYIHRGALQAVVFIADTSEFRAAELPGGLSEEARLALAARFVEIGFLEAAE